MGQEKSRGARGAREARNNVSNIEQFSPKAAGATKDLRAIGCSHRSVNKAGKWVWESCQFWHVSLALQTFVLVVWWRRSSRLVLPVGE